MFLALLRDSKIKMIERIKPMVDQVSSSSSGRFCSGHNAIALGIQGGQLHKE